LSLYCKVIYQHHRWTDTWTAHLP